MFFAKKFIGFTYLILPSLKSTCFLATGSYFLFPFFCHGFIVFFRDIKKPVFAVLFNLIFIEEGLAINIHTTIKPVLSRVAFFFF